MNHKNYYDRCVSKVRVEGFNFQKKPLEGLLLQDDLSQDLTERIVSQIEKENEKFREFVKGMSQILDVEVGGDMDKLIEEASGQIIPKLYDIFGCFVKIQEIKILRHLHLTPDNADWREGAFKWHSDQHPTELVNVMIYLDDVKNDESGPFQYVADNQDKPVYVNSISQFFDDDFVMSLGVKKSVYGNPGHFFVFDNNFIHRAAPTTGKKRDVIIFQVRPTSKKNETFLDWDYMKRSFNDQMQNWATYE